MPCAWARRNSSPRRAATARGRADTRAPQHRPDRRRAHPHAELAQLPLDPHTTPPRILAGEAHNQVPDGGIKRRPADRAVPVTPLPPHQLTVPTQQRLRRNQKHPPAIPRQQPTRGCQQQPVAPPKRRLLHRPPKHAQLVPEHRVLHLQRHDRRASREDAKQPPHRQVNQEQQHQTILRNRQPSDRNQSFAPYRQDLDAYPRPTRIPRHRGSITRVDRRDVWNRHRFESTYLDRRGLEPVWRADRAGRSAVARGHGPPRLAPDVVVSVQ